MIPSPPQERPAAPTATPSPRVPGGEAHRRGPLLGIAWLGSSFDAAVFRGPAVLGNWTASGPVRTVEEFAAALDRMLGALKFTGTETLLLLEHDQFIHRAESAPSFSESAARSYLQARVERHERECGEPVWCAQRTVSARQDASFMLHLLPTAFFEHLNQVLAARGLDLTRIYPLAVPLQLEIDALVAGTDDPMLVATEMSGITTILVGRSKNRLAFARTIRASWTDEPVRVSVEVNRSLLYAKQQLGTVVGRMRLFGADPGVEAVRAQCGENREIASESPRPVQWLKAAAGLAPRDPLNLVAGHLQRKRQRKLLRSGLAAACWLGLASMVVTAWSDQTVRSAELSRYATLKAREATLRTDYDRLLRRNAAMEADRAFVREAVGSRMPPVPGKTLGYFASILPKGIRLTEFDIEWSATAGHWVFRVSGTVEGEEEEAHAILDALQQQLEHGPLRAQITEPARVLAALPSPSNGAGVFGFAMGGTLFEN
jgi:hypothetical protein